MQLLRTKCITMVPPSVLILENLGIAECNKSSYLHLVKTPVSNKFSIA